MATIDPDHPGTADSTREDDASTQELAQGWMNRAQGLPDGQCELPRRELPLGIGAEDPKDADLRPGAQDILEHAPEIATRLFRYFDYMYDFSNGIQRTRRRAREPGPRSASATSSAPQE